PLPASEHTHRGVDAEAAAGLRPHAAVPAGDVVDAGARAVAADVAGDLELAAAPQAAVPHGHRDDGLRIDLGAHDAAERHELRAGEARDAEQLRGPGLDEVAADVHVVVEDRERVRRDAVARVLHAGADRMPL